MKSEEVNYKKNFCEKYFDSGCWDLDVLNKVDVLLKDKKGNFLLYIETKFIITNDAEYRSALAQVIITNKKQSRIMNRVALVYQDNKKNDVLELIDCSDNSVMYNNDINWKSEVPSHPTKDAIDRINDRIKNKITRYINEEIVELYKRIKKDQDVQFDITEDNVENVYNHWKNEISFRENVNDEQDLINLFLIDILNGTTYKKSFYEDIEENTLFGKEKTGTREVDTENDLIREGTNLSKYSIVYNSNSQVDGIKYEGKYRSTYYTIKNSEKYQEFWKKYKRPPEKHEFLKIIERSDRLYSDKYRRDTGGEYTPTCFVEKQNEILARYYNMNDFIVFDPCAGVGNLENQFGKDYKEYCYLSTLEQMDVDTCKIKGFENSVKFDYLENDEHPKFKYKGSLLDINDICKRENRKLMIVMNPPYQNKTGFKNNLAIEFFNKVLKLNPEVIVFYYTMESFFRDERMNYINSEYKIKSHIFSNAKTTFLLSEWPISQVIFDKNDGYEFNDDCIPADRYEINEKTDNLEYIKTYNYNVTKPYLIKSIEKEIKNNMTGTILGQWSYLTHVLVIGNGGKEKDNKITTNNLKYVLLSKGISFNTHAKYFERNYHCYKGSIEDISLELFSDSIIFSLFYKNNQFTNKDDKNYIMPFSAEELDCDKNDLNVLFPNEFGNDLFSNDLHDKPFDFREWLKQFEFSEEAKNLYNAALEIFKFYHRNKEYSNKDWNDSFYDVTNAIMGKDTSTFSELETENDTRITKTKTTKGTRGFGRNTIKYVINSEYLPIFEKFFDARDILAKKINKQLVDSGLLLWKRENIY